MQSPEYPELPFVPPAAYGTGRDGRKVMYSVVHYTAGSETRTSAEDGAAYDQRRTDGTSCHFFHDQNSTVQCVLTWNRSNSAFSKGNRLGVHHELCGTQQSRAQWLDEASYGTLQQAARWVAEDCKKYGLPVRRLSVAETRAAWYTANSAGPHGIVGHVDITRAYPEDGGTHEDPGTEFPWDVFLPLVQAYVSGGNPQTTSVGGDDVGRQMLIKADGKLYMVDGMLRRPVPDAWYNNGTGPISDQQVHQAALLGPMGTPYSTGGDLDVWGIDVEARVAARVADLYAADATRDTATLAAVNALAAQVAAGGGNVDTAAIVGAVNAAAGGTTSHVETLRAEIADLKAKLAAASRAAADELDA